MQWELWDVESGNLIGWRETEAEGLALVRELVGKGWPTEVLSLMVEDETVPVETVPPAVTGAELVAAPRMLRKGAVGLRDRSGERATAGNCAVLPGVRRSFAALHREPEDEILSPRSGQPLRTSTTCSG